MRKIILLSICFALALKGFGQAKKDLDKEAIRAICGLYKVTFEYAETFSVAADYELKKPYAIGGYEWIFVEEENADKLVLQHVLLIDDSTAMKHWREDWEYQNTELLVYDSLKKWHQVSYSPKEVQGTWTQKVFEVDDSPRYQCKGTWVYVDGKKYWEASCDSPLPRREMTKRKDYNVMHRVNRVELFDYGFQHMQENAKLIRKQSKDDELLVWERGANIYEKIPDWSGATYVKGWWKNERVFWGKVREAWSEIISGASNISIKPKSQYVSLSEMLDNLSRSNNISKEEIKEKILSYVEVS